MPYNRFRFKTVGEQLGLKIEFSEHLFRQITPIAPRPIITELLQPSGRYPLVSEISRREWLISILFRELIFQTKDHVTVYSGETFDVDASLGLVGEVDYLITLEEKSFPLSPPVVAVAEAKPNNLSTGMGQCIAEMFAAQLFNRRAGLNLPYTYGIVTTGTLWTFLSLNDRLVQITGREYGLSDLEEILGILIYMTTPQKT